MKNIGLIIHREYMSKVKTKAFILTTILMPFFFIGMIALPLLLATMGNSDISRVYVIDATGKYYDKLKTSDKYTFIPSTTDSASHGKTDALLQIDQLDENSPLAITFFSEQQKPPQELLAHIGNILNNAVQDERIEAFSKAEAVDPMVVAGLQDILKNKAKVNIDSKRWDQDGATKETLGEESIVIGTILTTVMFMFIIMYGSIVMQSVVEEKTNRIVEIIISSAKPFELMMGKIIGVGLTGLTQLAVWATIGILISVIGVGVFGNLDAGLNTDVSAIPAFLGMINWFKVIGLFILYFIGGYLMYASLFAMFGSAANDAQEAQQLMMPVTILLLGAFYCGMAAARNPEGSLAVWASIIPFTAPITMMIRLPYEVPIWQLGLSIGLLGITVYLMINLSARIYRVGILMYGKKPSFRELYKWMKYK